MAEEQDMEDIKKLPPEERIKKLRELEEKRKQEIEKAKELVKQSIEEITKKEEEKFVQGAVIKEEQERAVKRAAETPLEETVAKEEPKLTEEQAKAHGDYLRRLSEETTTKDIYNIAKGLAEGAQQKGYLNQQQWHTLGDLERAQAYKKQDIEQGKYKTAGEEISTMLTATKGILEDLKGKYKK